VAPEEKPKARQPEYTLYRSRRRAAVAPGEEPKRRSLADLIVRAGAVAAAIGSIVAVVALVWPDSPARQGAKLSNVSRERNVSLADFAARQEIAALNPRDDRGRPAEKLRGTGRPGLAVALLASAGAPADGAGATTPEPETTTPEPETTTPEPETTTPEPETTTPGAQRPSSRIGRRRAGSQGKESPTPGASEALNRRNEELATIVPPEDETEAYAAMVGADGDVVEGDDGAEPASRTEAIQSANKFLRALRGTRVRRSSSASGSVTQEVLGVTVSFDLQLEGLKGRHSYVRWSLYSARGNRRVPRDWLINRRVLSLQGKANEDRASKEFWVPLPRAKGPFFVRVSAYDDQGSRLTYEDTKPFR